MLQAIDTIDFQNDTYVINNSRLVHLPKPTDFGMMTYSSLALSSGYLAHYLVQNGKLYLKALRVNSMQELPDIQSVPAIPDEFRQLQANYDDLEDVVERDVKLLVGYPQIPYSVVSVHHYRILKGLHFYQGKLIEIIDYTKKARQLRRTFLWRKRFFKLSFVDEYRIISKQIPLQDYGYPSAQEILNQLKPSNN